MLQDPVQVVEIGCAMMHAYSSPRRFGAAMWHVLVLVGCGEGLARSSLQTTQPRPPPQAQPPRHDPATLLGVVSYDDGAPAADAVIAITSLASGARTAVVVADHRGRFEAALGTGDYALAITTEHGFGWIESMRVPNASATLTLSRDCRAISGRASPVVPGTRINLIRKSRFTGDTFIGPVQKDGSFALCLPESHYSAALTGGMLSLDRDVDLSTTAAVNASTQLVVEGFAADAVKQAPRDAAHMSADIDGLIADILAKDARLIGLGEATHGTAELVTTRSALTLELIRRAEVRLVLFEIDAIKATALDDYVIGRDVDLGKAVAALGFWVTDTEEFLRFLRDLRAHNTTTRDKVRVSGVDVQNTEAPVGVLLAHAGALRLTSEDQAMLKLLAEKRGAPVREFTTARRAALDALVARLGKLRGATDKDLRIAVAARSLAVQIGYLDGDRLALYSLRRDVGMASLASFLLVQARAPRACLWAHAGHVARDAQIGHLAMGHHLAAVPTNRYYPIGFYVFQGSVRAWDAAGAVGVISHPIPAAPAYGVEGAILAATRWPEVAWVPLSRLSPALRAWSATPRYIREYGAVQVGEESTMALRRILNAFDAIVVIKTGHDSTPTPTGVRKANN